MYLPVPGFGPMSSVFLGKCVTRWAAVAVMRRVYGLLLVQSSISFTIQSPQTIYASKFISMFDMNTIFPEFKCADSVAYTGLRVC